MSNLDLINAALELARKQLLKDFPEPTPVPTPVPTPIPTPVPTPIPAPGSTIQVQNMTLTNGVYRSNNLSADGKCYVAVVLSSPVPMGKTARLTFKRRTNVKTDGTKNIKVVRFSKDGDYNQPNDYIGRSLNTGADQITTEHNGVGNGTFAWLTFPFKDGVWQTEVYEMTYGASGSGKFKLTVDGSVVSDTTNWSCGTANRNQFDAQCVVANGVFPAGSYVEFSTPTIEIL